MKYASDLSKIDIIETGLFIDRITNGIPRGKITEIFGNKSVGKSTLCMQIVAAAQKQGLKCLWADIEFSYETVYSAKLGVDNKKLAIVREIEKGKKGEIYSSAEANLDAVLEAVEKGQWDLVVIDSIGALTPRAEFEKTSGEKVIAGQAGLVARFCRKIVPVIYGRNTALIVINHSFVDIMNHGAVKTSGGAKLDYHKSLSIELSPKGTYLKRGDEKVGKVIIAELRKDKIGGRDRAEAEGQLLFGGGFNIQLDLLEEAVRKGVIVKDRAKYFLGTEQIAYGQTAMRDWLKIDENVERLNNAMV